MRTYFSDPRHCYDDAGRPTPAFTEYINGVINGTARTAGGRAFDSAPAQLSKQDRAALLREMRDVVFGDRKPRQRDSAPVKRQRDARPVEPVPLLENRGMPMDAMAEMYATQGKLQGRVEQTRRSMMEPDQQHAGGHLWNTPEGRRAASDRRRAEELFGGVGRNRGAR